MGETTVYAATKSAEERLKKGGYKEKCAQGCACGTAATKKGTDGDIPKKEPAAKE